MTHDTPTAGTIAPLRNVMGFMGLLKEVEARDIALPGMATFYGPAGYGKSWAAAYAQINVDVCLVQCKSFWTRKKLVEAIATELRLAPRGTIADISEMVIGHLARFGTPLVIDEADHLLRLNMIELVRDIYEGSFAPVILIGEELLPGKLAKFERTHSRMYRWLKAEPLSDRDIGILMGMWCPGLTVEQDLIRDLAIASDGSARRVAVNLERIKAFALREGVDQVTRGRWGEEPFYTGQAPAPRNLR